MRVLHIVNDLTDRGNGIVNTAVDLAIEQARRGLSVTMASTGGAYQPLLESSGVPHLMLDPARSPARMLRSAWLLHRRLRHNPPDVVHAHMRTGLLLAWLLKPLHRYVLLGHFHNVHDRESILMGLADRTIAVSRSVAASMASLGIPGRKIRVVLNRTLGSRRVPAIDSIQPAALIHPAIVTVCGMSRRKGIDELIRAFELVQSHLPQAQLYLVGDGPDRREFELQAEKSRSSESIHFEGYRPVPQAYMLSADAFVLASRRESFGLVLIEARRAGCAIVATDVDGVSEALDNGCAGNLVPLGNTAALADALLAVLRNPAQKAEWQKRAKEHISEFHISRMAAEMIAVYEELILEKRPSNRTGSAKSNAAVPPVNLKSQPRADRPESQEARL